MICLAHFFAISDICRIAKKGAPTLEQRRRTSSRSNKDRHLNTPHLWTGGGKFATMRHHKTKGITMEVCIAYLRGKPIMLELRDGIAYLDNEPQPIKYLDEEKLQEFSDSIQAIPYSADPGYEALVNSKRAAFIVTLIGSAVGEECVSRLTHLLDHVHYDVLEYLGETGEEDA